MSNVKAKGKLSNFEKVFGINSSIDSDDDLSNLIAIIRDKFPDLITSKIPESSAASSPSCVLYAVHELLDDLNKIKYNSVFDMLLKINNLIESDKLPIKLLEFIGYNFSIPQNITVSIQYNKHNKICFAFQTTSSYESNSIALIPTDDINKFLK